MGLKLGAVYAEQVVVPIGVKLLDREGILSATVISEVFDQDRSSNLVFLQVRVLVCLVIKVGVVQSIDATD